MAVRRKQQTGMAMLMAIFAIMLLSALGLAMLFSADTETSISGNYRDKQSAMYAALAGLEEARDRVHPKTGDPAILALVPKDLPSLTSKNILYIINPAPGETVAPWDPGNPYFDTELCQENILGMTGTFGVPCNPKKSGQAPPGGTAWYSVYDNSQNATAWQIKDVSGNKIPLSYKWVRIQLKADNVTPAPVGLTPSGKQVCWSGNHEEQAGPTGCAPSMSGQLSYIAPVALGNGYTSAPTVTVTGGGGSGATATATIQTVPGDAVTSVLKIDGGKGYTSKPNVTVQSVDGAGSGAKVEAVMGGSPVASVALNVTQPSPCYPENTLVQASFDATYGLGATGTVHMSGRRCVYDFASSGECTQAGSFSISGAGGSGSSASGTVTFAHQGNSYTRTSIKVDNPGNYDSLPSNFTASDNKCAGLTVTPIFGVQIDSVTVDNGGAYSQPPDVSFFASPATKGSGSISGKGQLSGTSLAPPDTVQALVLTAGGSGYTSNPNLIIDPCTGPGCTTATGTATIGSTGVVVGYKITNPGSNYTSPPNITVTGGGGTGATAQATISTGVSRGDVYLLTSMALTPAGTKAVSQMEVGSMYSKFTFPITSALTLGGPNPNFNSADASQFEIRGADANSCGEDPVPPKPAIGVYQDPNVPLQPGQPTAMESVYDALKRPENITGAGDPSIDNIYSALGGQMTAEGLAAFADAVCDAAKPTNVYANNPSTIDFGTPTAPTIDCVNGDYQISGNPHGYGILLVRGNLTLGGNYSWNGLVLVIGKGAGVFNGGGNGVVTGSVFIGNTDGENLNSPSGTWKGGGGNSIYYDHCWADNLLPLVPYKPPANSKPMQVISVRTLP